MRICIVCEGCYPYVVGGVSSWVQQLITMMPKHEFIICAIAALKEQKGKFKYTLPKNVIEVHELFLDSLQNDSGVLTKHKITEEQKTDIQNLMLGDAYNYKSIFELFYDIEQSIQDFLMSRDFYDIARHVYLQKYSSEVFVDFIWTLRSMYTTFFFILKQKIPKADLYHAVSTGYAGILSVMGKTQYNKPFILTEHGIYTREREEDIIKADWVKGHFKELWIDFFYNMSKCAYQYADKVISLFDTNRKIQIDIGCAHEKTMVIPNGINVELFEKLPIKDEEEKAINIGAIVRIVAIKDIKTMLNAFDIVKTSVPNSKFIIMGPTEEDPVYYEECIVQLKELGTRDVIFTGSVNIKEYINKMDIIVLSSISEAQPLAVIEAMTTGKPVVATNVGSCMELLYGGEGDDLGNCGFVTPVMDYESFASKIILLCENSKLREHFGEVASKRIRKYYREDIFLNSYKQLYSSFEDTK